MATNTKDIANTEPELWDVTSPPETTPNFFYMSISGNTGAGKSTLIRNVVEQAKDRGTNILGISERTLHHPYLRRMFADPARYAYPVQLNFMLHRHLILLRQMELGRSIFMERSHLDDELFLREHLNEGNVSSAQSAAYSALSEVLHGRVPLPNLLILMNPKPELSIERVNQAEARGDRPREFPDEASKRQWVHRWYNLYEEFHARLAERQAQDPRMSKIRLLVLDPATSQESRICSVMQTLTAMGVVADAVAS